MRIILHYTWKCFVTCQVLQKQELVFSAMCWGSRYCFPPSCYITVWGFTQLSLLSCSLLRPCSAAFPDLWVWCDPWLSRDTLSLMDLASVCALSQIAALLCCVLGLCSLRMAHHPVSPFSSGGYSFTWQNISRTLSGSCKWGSWGTESKWNLILSVVEVRKLYFCLPDGML